MGSDQRASELLREARAAAVAIQESLVNPDAAALRESLPLFELAVDRLHRLHVMLREKPEVRSSALAGSALQLQKDVARLRVLLESGARFRAGWMRRLGAQFAGYTAQGVPSPLPGGCRILAEG